MHVLLIIIRTNPHIGPYSGEAASLRYVGPQNVDWKRLIFCSDLSSATAMPKRNANTQAADKKNDERN